LEIGKYLIDLRDTAGQERYRSMAGIFFRNASVSLFAYDITALASLHAIRDFFLMYHDSGPKESRSILVGLKKDLAEQGQRNVSIRTAEEFAHGLDPPIQDIVEVSSKEGEGINELREAIEKAFAELNPETNQMDILKKRKRKKKWC
jgi:GTPase SAR1 family protein